jgi:hypothetical protein
MLSFNLNPMKKTSILFLLSFLCTFGIQAQFIQIGAQLDGNAPNDNFGWSVDLDRFGKTLAVGAPLFDNDFGQVRVYRQSGGNWGQIGQDIDGIEFANQIGFSVALNFDGTRLAIGGISGATARGGQVQVYGWNNGQWNLLGSPILAEVDGDQFGFSLAMNASGDRIVVGGRNNDGNGSEAGHVRVFEWQNNSWQQLGADLDGENAGDLFGSSVSINSDGSIIAVGAPNHDGAGGNSGRVKVYQWQNNSWQQVGADLDGQTAGELFGSNIGLSDDGTRLVVAAALHGHVTGFGSTRVYEYGSNAWTQLGSDIRGNSTQEAFGEDVKISGDGLRLVIGTKSADENALSSGRANVYAWENGSWIELGDPILGTAQFDNLGKSVAINEDGSRVAIGANLANGTQGYALVYQDSLMPVGIRPDLLPQTLQLVASSSQLSLRSTDAADLSAGTLEILSLSGQVVVKQTFAPSSTLTLTHHLPAGLYLIRVRTADQWYSQKLLIPAE